MIYKDLYFGKDTTSMPYNRDENCLNCGCRFSYHVGWACEDYFEYPKRTDFFSMSRLNHQYLTQSMKDSVDLNKPPYIVVNRPISDMCINPLIAAKPGIDQWQAWSHNQPGDCACGIKKDSCDYHKNP